MYTAEIWIERTDETIDKTFLTSDSIAEVHTLARHVMRAGLADKFHPAWTAGAEILEGEKLLFSIYETAMDPLKYTREAIF